MYNNVIILKESKKKGKKVKMEIKEILNLCNVNNVAELRFENKDVKIYIKRDTVNFNESKLEVETIDKICSGECISSEYLKIKSHLVGEVVQLNYGKDSMIINEVKKGTVLCIIESMKMMHEIISPVNGIVKLVNIKEYEVIEYGQVLFEIEETKDNDCS